MKRKKRNLFGASLLLMVVMLAGCGKTASTQETKPSMPNGGENNRITEDAYEISERSMEEVETAKAAETANGATGEIERTVNTQKVASNRKLIKTINLDVETDSYDILIPNVEDKITQLGGYIESSNTYNGSFYQDSYTTRRAEVTARIPNEELDAFIAVVGETANIIRKSQTTEDVTLQYVDTKAHKEMLEIEQARLLELLEKAESIEDIITIEGRISEVRYEIESMGSALRTYDNLVDYSTVYLVIQEVKIYTPQAEITTMQKMRAGFLESMYYVKEGFTNFAIGFISRIPYFIVFGVILSILLLFVKIVRKIIRKKKSIKKSETTTESMEKQQNE